MSRVPSVLRNKLLALAVTFAAGGGAYIGLHDDTPPEVLIAMEMAQHYESSGRHIGVPYIDKVGKGQPLTVCAGVTGPEVVAGRYYTPEDCKRLERPHFIKAWKLAKSSLKFWHTYNIWVKASFVDAGYNLPGSLHPGTTLMLKANAGDLQGACMQMPRWVFGTLANGQKVRLAGLVDRTGTRAELCSDWGRDGHFSVDPR